MTLEKIAPSLEFTNDNSINRSLSQKLKYFTLPHSQKYQESTISTKVIKNELNVNRRRVLSRTVSDNTFLDLPSKLTRQSSEHVECSKERKGSFKKRCESTIDVNPSRNPQSPGTLASKNDRSFRNYSVKELSSFDSKRTTLTSGAKVLERGSRSAFVTSTLRPKSECPGEILLEFPGSGNRSFHVSTGKTKDIKPERSHSVIQHSMSMPGLSDSLIKDGGPNLNNGKINGSKSRPFFLFFRKKVAKYDRSPSPSATKSNIRRCPSTPTYISQEPERRTPSPPGRERRLSGHSMTSSKQAQNSSNIPGTPSTYMSITSPTASNSNSPTSTDKLPYYMTRSRSKQRRSSKRSSSKKAEVPQPEDRLTFEDLPPHPSLLKKTIEKTYSYPSTPIFKQNNTKTINRKVNNKTLVSSDCRRNSMPESSILVKENTTKDIEKCQNSKDLKKEESTQIKRKISVESSGKTSSAESFHEAVTTSSSDQTKPLSNRSLSVPMVAIDVHIPDTDIRVISDAEDFEYSPTNMEGPLNLMLCGCGFLGMYHLGVVSCLAQRGSSFVERLQKVGGASAGAIMAAVLVTCSDKIEESAEHIQNLAKEIRKKPLGPLTPGYSFARSLRYMLDDILPQEAHETAKEKLFVSVTNAETKKNEMLTDFKSREELIEALVASCYIPIYAGIKLPTIRGKKYIDGGLSNNLPKFETGRTITVSPFDGKSDIGPKIGQEAERKAHFINVQNHDIQVNVNNIKKGSQAFFPPKPQTLHDYFEKGRYDTNRFLIREGLYEVTAPSQKKAVLYESSV